jgi:hypothetical protein
MLIFIQEKDLTFANFVEKHLQAVEISKFMSELHIQGINVVNDYSYNSI